MSFNIGDVVVLSTRKGAVQYTVTAIPVPGEQITIKSHNSGKETVVGFDRLTLVHSDFLSDDEIETEIAEQSDPRDDSTEPALTTLEKSYEELYDTVPGMLSARKRAEIEARRVEHPMPTWEVELSVAQLDPKRPYLLTVDHVTTAHKTYNAACDALILAAREGFKHYAVIDHDGERLATRTAA
jgi:hypothetical protein